MQEKVEKSRRKLCRKIYYDLIKQKKPGVNWVKCLLRYMKCLNQEKREYSGWKSAFEIYLGRKVNEPKNEGKNHDKTIDLAKTVGLSTKDLETRNITLINGDKGTRSRFQNGGKDDGKGYSQKFL